MEIERKFWLKAFPEDLPLLQRMQTWQGYLYTEPNEVRIRRHRREESGEEFYRLTIKSGGDLARHEVELPLTAEQFEELRGLLDPSKPLIHKDYRAYDLGGGLTLECSVVDGGAFSYAEVEFPSEAAANAWQPLDCLGPETTYRSGFKLHQYWLNRSLKRQNPYREDENDG